MVEYSEVCLAKKFGNHLFDVGIKLTITEASFVCIMPILTDMEISFFIFQGDPA